MNTYALVLAGGGGKGAYQIGAWKALRELNISFNAIAGTSIGSINGALIAAGDYDKAWEFWHSVSLDKGVKLAESLPDSDNLFSMKNWGVLFKEFLKNGGIDASPAEQLVASYVDEKKVRESGIPLGIVTVQMSQEITPLELFTQDIPEGELVDYLLASSNIPFAMNIGPEGEKFLDGGAYDNIPVMTLKKRGYNKLIVIDISNIKGIAHTLDFLNSQIVYIRPYDLEQLGPSFDFDDEIIDRRIKLGYLDTRKAFSFLQGKIYYFSPEVFKSMVEKYGADTVQQLELLAYELGVELINVYDEKEFILNTKLAYEQELIRIAEREREKEEKEAEKEREKELEKEKRKEREAERERERELEREIRKERRKEREEERERRKEKDKNEDGETDAQAKDSVDIISPEEKAEEQDGESRKERRKERDEEREARKEKRKEKEKEKEIEKEQEGEDETERRGFFMRFIRSQKKKNENYSDAIALLENYII